MHARPQKGTGFSEEIRFRVARLSVLSFVKKPSRDPRSLLLLPTPLGMLRSRAGFARLRAARGMSSGGPSVHDAHQRIPASPLTAFHQTMDRLSYGFMMEGAC